MTSFTLLLSRYKTQKFFRVWVKDARNIYKCFFIKNHYWELKLSIVAFSSVIVLSLKLKKKKKHSEKDVNRLKTKKKFFT